MRFTPSASRVISESSLQLISIGTTYEDLSAGRATGVAHSTNSISLPPPTTATSSLKGRRHGSFAVAAPFSGRLQNNQSQNCERIRSFSLATRRCCSHFKGLGHGAVTQILWGESCRGAKTTLTVLQASHRWSIPGYVAMTNNSLETIRRLYWQSRRLTTRI